MGNSSGLLNRSGSNNTFIGSQSGDNNRTGSSNTIIGSFADLSDTAFINATALGNSASVSASNKIRLGNTAITKVEGQVAYSFPSDQRFKFNVKQNVPGLNFIKKLRPVTYQFNTQQFDAFQHKKDADYVASLQPQSFEAATNIIHTGLLAQEVEIAMKASGYNFDGLNKPANDDDYYTLSYELLTIPLIQSVQELNEVLESTVKKQQDAIKELETVNDKQQQVNEYLQQQINELKNLLQNTTSATSSSANASGFPSKAVLLQNQPNPFYNSTVIKYFIPITITSAMLQISNQQGVIVKTVNITQKGNGQVIIEAGSLSSGTYNYSLIVDGKPVDSKKMILIK